MNIRDFKRDREIYEKHKQGSANIELAREYGLSRERIRQIIWREEADRRREEYIRELRAKWGKNPPEGQG